jgi:enoyl-CoA hydratase
MSEADGIGIAGSGMTGISVFEFDRPERGNALSAELVEALHAALVRAVADPSVHTLVLRGQGRHFCTGFDLSTLHTETDATLLARFVQIELLLDALWRAPLRTVALGHGRIMGAGADLFAACDLRLLAPGASLRFPGAGFGIVLGTRRLARRVGESRALRWVSEATTISESEALATGLANGSFDAAAASPPASAVSAAAPVAPASGVDADPASLATTLVHRLAPLSVDRSTYAALRGALDDRGADADLAALVRSAAQPGLRARIVAYRDRQLAKRN